MTFIEEISEYCVRVNTEVNFRLLPDSNGDWWSWRYQEGGLSVNWVNVERCGEELLVDGREVELFFVDRQQTESHVCGADVWSALARHKVPDQIVANVLLHHTWLIPSGWMQNSYGECQSVCFWGRSGARVLRRENMNRYNWRLREAGMNSIFDRAAPAVVFK